jgi:radical SAM superfamily enzyme YgiQ (UPF0313 family)
MDCLDVIALAQRRGKAVVVGGPDVTSEPQFYEDADFLVLGEADHSLGLNFETLRPRRDVCADYRTVIDRIYAPRAYFGRLNRVARELRCYRSRPSRRSTST